MVDDRQLHFDGKWRETSASMPLVELLHASAQAGASRSIASMAQVRSIWRAGHKGGLADVYVDDVKQLVLH